MRAPCLVVATSGRLIAEALAAGGCTVDVLDAFADADCRAAARCCTALPWSSATDPAPAAAPLEAATLAWAQAHPGGILLAGAGFEHRPALLARLAAHLPLAGTRAPAVARCKDPWQLAQACAQRGLATPSLCRPGSQTAGGWLLRRTGACGGAHLRTARPDDGDDGRQVWQRHTAGQAVSLLFHAGAGGTVALSWQHQYCAPTPRQPWRFGGVLAVDPADAPWAPAIERAAHRLAGEFGLQGLNGLDALWDGGTLWVLEINPRPPASFALLPPAARAHWICAHVATAGAAWHDADAATQEKDPGAGAAEACAGGFARHALNAGMAVVYASTRLSIPADFRFPPGCHDLPVPPCTFGAGDPVCSVQTEAGGIEKLRARIGCLRERLLPLAGADVLSSL
ncbi:MAG: ATP-grasp domain-containing protein [Pseudomonadota bacterium]|nr:ATP-grasp domain-containing protein [Pseudomonadota bacterium]